MRGISQQVFQLFDSLREQEKEAGYFSDGFLGLPRFLIVDSIRSVMAMLACQSSLQNGCCRLTLVRNVISS